LSFNQDIARIGGGGRDEGNPAVLSGCRLLAHPFRQGAGLSKTPSSTISAVAMISAPAEPSHIRCYS
jgi:hypothetical protein